MYHFEYYQPDSLCEVIGLLARYPGEAVLLAGGTALLVDLRHKEAAPAHVVSLWGVPGLGEMSNTEGMNSVGALATVRELVGCDLQPGCLALVDAARMFGCRQVQNVATLGGNICEASPAADLVPPLLCLGAQLCLEGPQGARQTPVEGFLLGPDQTAIRPGEVLTEVLLPPLPPRSGSAFQKFMRRKAVDLAVVSAAVRVTLAEDEETILEARVALGAVAPYPFRPQGTETLLQGEKVSPELLRQAGAEASREARPISDVRASADFRRMLVDTLVQRALETAVQRSRQGGNNS